MDFGPLQLFVIIYKTYAIQRAKWIRDGRTAQTSYLAIRETHLRLASIIPQLWPHIDPQHATLFCW